jgi:predicted nucleotidyltransferase
MARLSSQEQIALRDFVDEVRRRFGQRLTEVTLFGSRARGEGRSDSDLDVFVRLQNLSRDDRRSVQDLAFDVGFARGLIISPVLADATTWRVDLPLGQAIAREGVPL